MDQHLLTPLFSPRSIVVFEGTSAETAGSTELVVQSILDGGYEGHLERITLNHVGTLSELASFRADLAVIALDEKEIPRALEVAGGIHCRSTVVIGRHTSASDAETLHAIARRHDMLLLGPNSQGIQRPHLRLNASVSGPLATGGSLALVTQSGALTASMLDWARMNKVGFSTVVTLGPHSRLDLPDVLDFLAADSTTHSILLCMEGIRNARRFMSALRAAAASKPVVVMKAGRRPIGAEAAATHSGALVGSDEVFEAVLRRAGVVRVRSFTQLFSAAKSLASRFKPVGKRLAIVSNGGGPAVMAADWVDEIQLQVARLDPDLRQELAGKVSPHAQLDLILDLTETATPAQIKETLLACARDTGIDGVVVVYSPVPGSDGDGIAKALGEVLGRLGKPLLTCWMGDERVRSGRELLNAARIPTFRTPEAAVGAFSNIASFYQNQQLLQQTPSPLSTLGKPDVEGARLLIEGMLSERRRVLTEMESKALLSAFHIPVTRTMLARTASEAMLIANQLGYPVALKIDSPDICHKSDVEGVVLNVVSATRVRDAYNDMLASVKSAQPQARINGVTIQPMCVKKRGRELFIGVKTDAVMGPVITFGAGGTMVELIADRALALPPLNPFLALRLIERSRAFETLGEWHGAPPVDLEALEQILLRVSEMVCELPQLRELDINPIIVDEQGALAVDARIVIEQAPTSTRPYSHLAILPYPATYEREWPMKGGGFYKVRPIHPEDAQALQGFVRGLSPQSRYFRFASGMAELPARMLARYTLIDYDREMALVAEHRVREPDGEGGFTERSAIIGVSRYITNPDQTTCEFSLVVGDDFAGQGLGSRLMLSIMDFARDKGLTEIEGLVLANNHNMLKLMRGLGFSIQAYEEDPDFVRVVKSLQ